MVGLCWVNLDWPFFSRSLSLFHIHVDVEPRVFQGKLALKTRKAHEAQGENREKIRVQVKTSFVAKIS